ncbi:unnamed protein product [Cladocopium goreaui]|uniref:Methyltransferase type 11 domain-containing protein n=1 Tax=Cladocopium goreaui TaxID=2562237 RepID=A0A9P1BUY5_9DINO|nr:unnamed protein product [Cladocopium goreaui]
MTHGGYEVPQLLLSLLPQRKFQRSVDLGCGTGLAGLAIRSRCERLEGVDLSSRMVEKAAEREIYDALHCSDLVAFLRRQETASCDLLVATDVVMYLYSIEPFLHQARRVLRGSGVLIFSTEAASEAEAEAHGGTVERASERFAHGRSFLLKSAEGFDLMDVKEVNIRRQGTSTVQCSSVVVPHLPGEGCSPPAR